MGYYSGAMDPVPAEGTVVLSGDQQIVLSAEDAAQLLTQAGIQIGDNEQVIIGTQGQGPAVSDGTKPTDGQQMIEAALSAAGQTNASDQVITVKDIMKLCDTEKKLIGLQHHLISGAGDAVPGAVDDGTILYIDPNDPQAAEILQQAGLRLAEDGTVQQANVEGEGLNLEAAPVVEPEVTSTDGISATLGAQKPTEIPMKQASNGQQQVFEDAMVSRYFAEVQGA